MRAIRTIPFLAAAGGALVLAGSQTATADPGDGLADSAHDFTQRSSEEVGLCTFCHTPHRAQQTKLLWNHELSVLTYSWNDTTVTTGGTPLPTFDASWQGVSKNCLSCHDGTVAIGDVAWFDAQADRNLDNRRHDDPDDPVLITFANPGTGDLAGNHPVAHPFPFQVQASTYNGVTSGAQAVLSELGGALLLFVLLPSVPAENRISDHGGSALFAFALRDFLGEQRHNDSWIHRSQVLKESAASFLEEEF